MTPMDCRPKAGQVVWRCIVGTCLVHDVVYATLRARIQHFTRASLSQIPITHLVAVGTSLDQEERHDSLHEGTQEVVARKRVLCHLQLEHLLPQVSEHLVVVVDGESCRQQACL